MASVGAGERLLSGWCVSQHEVMEWVTRDIEGMLVGASYESLHVKVTDKASSD